MAISGATAASYTTPATTSSETGTQFTVVVTDSNGSVTSNPATLTVTAAAVAPSITSQPANQNRHGRTNGDFQRDGDGHGASYVSMEEERRSHQRRNFGFLHDSGHSGLG